MRYLPLFVAASALALTGCTAVGTAVGVGATAGIAASQEGGIERAVDDARIQIEINDLWLNYSFEAFRKLDLTINHGRVLITGVVQNPEHRVEAVRLAWQPEGVKQVINEIRVAESAGITGFAKDTFITTRLRTALTFEREVESINYSIDTVQGTVYLMGFANSQKELNRVVEIARTIGGVQNVVSYVQVYEAREDYTPSRPAPAAYDDQSNSYNSGQQPLVIAPEAQSGQSMGATSQPQGLTPQDTSRPYIVRDPVQADNMRARDAQKQRVEGNYKQGIDREEIQWNQ